MIPAPLRRIRAGVAILLFAASAAYACGTDFPWQLLGRRAQTLDDLPVDSFDFAMRHLVPRPDPRLPRTGARGGGRAGASPATWRLTPPRCGATCRMSLRIRPEPCPAAC